MLSTKLGVESTKGFADGTVFLEIEEMAGPITHLSLGFLDEEGLGDTDLRGILLNGHGSNVAGEDGVGGLDGRYHIS